MHKLKDVSNKCSVFCLLPYKNCILKCIAQVVAIHVRSVILFYAYLNNLDNMPAADMVS